MMIDANEFLLIVVYILGSVLLFALTILVLRLIRTLKKVDRLLDDLQGKSEQLNGVFTLVDRSSSVMNSIAGNVGSGIVNFATNFFKNRKGRDEEDE